MPIAVDNSAQHINTRIQNCNTNGYWLIMFIDDHLLAPLCSRIVNCVLFGLLLEYVDRVYDKNSLPFEWWTNAVACSWTMLVIDALRISFSVLLGNWAYFRNGLIHFSPPSPSNDDIFTFFAYSQLSQPAASRRTNPTANIGRWSAKDWEQYKPRKKSNNLMTCQSMVQLKHGIVEITM